MFGFLKKLFRRPAPEGRCSRIHGVKPFAATPEEAADIRRLEAARDAAWRRAWLKANSDIHPIEWKG